VVTNYAKKIQNAPPPPMIAAYLAQTQNASVKRCTEFLFSEHRDWAAHKDNVLAQGDVDYNRSRDYCQYLAWKEAHAYAKEMGKSDEDAANAGRQSIHAASTEPELRSFRNSGGRKNWAQRIRDRIDADRIDAVIRARESSDAGLTCARRAGGVTPVLRDGGLLRQASRNTGFDSLRTTPASESLHVQQHCLEHEHCTVHECSEVIRDVGLVGLGAKVGDISPQG
jgi:hypothetical protein